MIDFFLNNKARHFDDLVKEEAVLFHFKMLKRVVREDIPFDIRCKIVFQARCGGICSYLVTNSFIHLKIG